VTQALERVNELDADRSKLEFVREGLASDERHLILAVAEAKRECGELMVKVEEQSRRCTEVDAEISRTKLEREGLRWEAALLQRRLRTAGQEAEALDDETASLRERLSAERATYEKAVLDIFRLEQQLRQRR